MKKIVITGVIFFTLTSKSTQIFANELMSTADSLDTNGWQISAYGQNVKQKPILDVSSGGSIQIPVSGGGTTTVFTDSDSEVEMDAEFQGTILALTYRHQDGLHYRLKFGQIQDYELEFDSGPVTNSLRAMDGGWVWGAGVRWNATQATQVSAGMSLDLSYTRTMIDFDRFQTGTTVIPTDEKFEQDEYQAAVNVSRRWKQIEPYGGLKIGRLVSHLTDNVSKSQARGDKDFISPFVGLSFEPFPSQAFVVEGSFIDEEAINFGINLRFQ